MRRNRLLRPPAVERGRFERLRLILGWLNRDLVDGQQALRELVLVLDRFRHMKTRALPGEDLGRVESHGASCDWVLFRHYLRRAVWKQLRAVTNVPNMKSLAVPCAPHHLTLVHTELIGPVYFEYQVGIFPAELEARSPISPAKLQNWLYQYLLDMLFGDLVGMATAAVGLCAECDKFFVNRRQIFRQFCSAQCRWKNAARRSQRGAQGHATTAASETRAVLPRRRRGQRIPRRLNQSALKPLDLTEQIKQISEKPRGKVGPWPEAQELLDQKETPPWEM